MDYVVSDNKISMVIQSGSLFDFAHIAGDGDIDVAVKVTPADVRGDLENERGDMVLPFVTVNVSMSVNGENINQAAAPYSISIDLSGLDFGEGLEINLDSDRVNAHRLIAIDDNDKIVSSRFDSKTRLFAFTTKETGNFTITYIESLMRLEMRIDSFTICDLAGNAPIQIMDVLPIIQYDNVLIPIRFVAEALGAKIDWTPQTDTSPLVVHITLDGQTLSFGVGEMKPELAALGMDLPAKIVNGRTMVPLGFVSEFFDALVGWDEITGNIEIIKIK